MGWVRVEELGKVPEHSAHGVFDLCCHDETENWAAVQRSSQNPLVFFQQGRPAAKLALQRCKEALWRLEHQQFRAASLEDEMKKQREAQKKALDDGHDARCRELVKDRDFMHHLRRLAYE